MQPQNIVVQKYGGATLATPEKIKQVAQRISETSRSGKKLIVVVSAMGSTTNSLIELAHQVSALPEPREMDMLLSVGERISMALMSMALQDLNCPAISFTGSQAGVFTTNSPMNAQIIDVKAFRVEQALKEGKVVILAGFQGVCPVTKEITTLGRGGSDTSAVAMATAFQAERCEILKDVSGVYTADPKIIPHARPLAQLNFEQMREMTFWGAKVLHSRSVDLAQSKNVSLYIGPAGKMKEGTMISDKNSYEKSQPLAVNSHASLLEISVPQSHTTEAYEYLAHTLTEQKLNMGQILFSKTDPQATIFYMTGPQELLSSIRKINLKKIALSPKELASVTLTCSGTTRPELFGEIVQKMTSLSIPMESIQVSGFSVSLILEQKFREKCVQALHELIP